MEPAAETRLLLFHLTAPETGHPCWSPFGWHLGYDGKCYKKDLFIPLSGLWWNFACSSATHGHSRAWREQWFLIGSVRTVLCGQGGRPWFLSPSCKYRLPFGLWRSPKENTNVRRRAGRTVHRQQCLCFALNSMKDHLVNKREWKGQWRISVMLVGFVFDPPPWVQPREFLWGDAWVCCGATFCWKSAPKLCPGVSFLQRHQWRGSTGPRAILPSSITPSGQTLNQHEDLENTSPKWSSKHWAVGKSGVKIASPLCWENHLEKHFICCHLCRMHPALGLSRI